MHPATRIQGYVKLNRDMTHVCSTPLVVYTDGSKSDNGVGSAFVVYNNKVEVYNRKYRLPEYCSVFQAELQAISKTLEYLQTIDNLPSTSIFSDSFSSLQAINDRTSKNALVINIQKQLHDSRCRGDTVSLLWVKAHMGTIGNERADELAKDCCSDDAIPIHMEAPLSFAKRQLLKCAHSEWEARWQQSDKGRWTAKFFPSIIDRTKTGRISHDFVTTQFLSGHGKFGTYLASRQCRPDPSCECGEPQSCEHIVLACPMLTEERRQLETACLLEGFSLSLNTLPRMIMDGQLRTTAIQMFHRMHSRLLEWELDAPNT